MKTTFVTVLKNKEFTKLWFSQLISLVCANMLNFILIGRIYEQTSSTIAVGLLWGFYILPSITFGPFAGVLLDYINKKRALIFSSLIQTFIVLLYLGTQDKIWPIYSIVLLYSLCDEFFNPAVAVLIPSLVKKNQLAAANSLFIFTVQGSLVLGFLTGGTLLKILGFTRAPFILASFLLLLSAILASLLRWEEGEHRDFKKKTSPKDFFKDFWLELFRGYNFIRGEPRVLFPIILLGGLQVILGMGIILFPSFVGKLLRIDFADSPYVLITPAVLGAITGSFMVEKFIKRHLKRVLIIRGLFLLGFSVLAAGAFLPFFFLPLVLVVPLVFLMGLSFILMFIPLQVLIQENTPFSVRGKVFGTLNTLIAIAAVIPVLMTVTLVDFLGIEKVLVTGGVALIGLAFYAAKGKYGILSNYNRP